MLSPGDFGPADFGRWTLQAFGLLYLIGAAFGLRMVWGLARIESMAVKLERIAAEAEGAEPPGHEDGEIGRTRWMAAGLVITFAAGGAMALASHWSVPLLALLVAHQLAYFIRQRRFELKAATDAEAESARPANSTRNAAFLVMALAVFAAILSAAGALR